MKHQVVFGIWTDRELRGEGGVAIHQLWFSKSRSTSARLQHSDFPIQLNRLARLPRVATTGVGNPRGHVGEMAVGGPKADLPRIQRLAHIAPVSFRCVTVCYNG